MVAITASACPEIVQQPLFFFLRLPPSIPLSAAPASPPMAAPLEEVVVHSAAGVGSLLCWCHRIQACRPAKCHRLHWPRYNRQRSFSLNPQHTCHGSGLDTLF